MTTRRQELIDKLSDQMDAENAAAFVREVIDEAIASLKPCECGCGKLAEGGMMEAAHPEDYSSAGAERGCE